MSLVKSRKELDSLAARLEPYDLVSFDVFDTLVSRRVSTRFASLASANELIANLGLGVNPIGSNEALALRDDAYRIALKKRGVTAEDCLLKEWINEWVNLAVDQSGSVVDAEQLAAKVFELETQLEKTVSFAAPGMVALVQELVAAGKKVVYTSDMYLGEQIVGNILESANFPSFYMGFVSGDYGYLKRTGNLFRVLLETTNYAPHQIAHVGDNYHSDGVQPLQFGIDSFHIQVPEALQVRANKEVNFSHAILDPSAWHRVIDDFAGDANPISESKLDGIEHMSRGLASVLVPWMHDVWKQTIDSGFTHVLFAAREGYALHKIFGSIAEELGTRHSATLHYFGISRMSTLCTLGSEISLALLQALLANSQSPTLDNLADCIGMDRKRLRELGEEEGFHSNEERWLNLLDPRVAQLLLNPELLAAWKRLQRANYAGLSLYVRDLLITSNSKIAFVDLGWSARTQDGLEKLISSIAPGAELHGFYFGLSGDARRNTRHGSKSDFLGQTISNDFLNHIIFDNRIFLENLIEAPHPTVVGYSRNRSKGFVRLQQESNELAQLAHTARMARAQLLDGVLKYARAYAKLNNVMRFEPREFFEGSKVTFAKLASLPSRSQVQHLSFWNQSGLGSDEVTPLVSLKHSARWSLRPELGLWKGGSLRANFGLLASLLYLTYSSARTYFPKVVSPSCKQNRAVQSGRISDRRTSENSQTWLMDYAENAHAALLRGFSEEDSSENRIAFSHLSQMVALRSSYYAARLARWIFRKSLPAWERPAVRVEFSKLIRREVLRRSFAR